MKPATAGNNVGAEAVPKIDWSTELTPYPYGDLGTTRVAGPLMSRHVIDGHEVLLPADAKLHPRVAADDTIDPNEPLSGTF